MKISKRRKIIQFAFEHNGTMWVLCDDGTVWYRVSRKWRRDKWIQDKMANIPTDKEVKELEYLNN